MRTAIVSDIHGNLTALEAVVADIESRGVDRVVHVGDLALTGGQPAEVIDRVRELGWPGVVGNTDELLWKPEQHDEQLERAPKLKPLLDLVFGFYRPATLERIGDERLDWLRALPAEFHEHELALVHASPGDLWRAPAPDADDAALREVYDPLDARTVIYGHIHLPYVRVLGGRTVVNSGSVGMPFDGDPRASYVLLEPAVPPQIVRVEYDVEREHAALLASGYPDGPRISEMHRQGRFLPVVTDA